MIRKLFILLLTGSILIISFITLWTNVSSTTTEYTDTLQAANGLYRSGNYLEAIQLYKQILDQGIRDPVVFHNLGNSYSQLGDDGRALLFYRRAAALNPRDPVLQQYLEQTRATVADSPSDANSNPIYRFALISMGLFSLNELAFASLGMWLSFTLLLLMTQMVRYKRMKSILTTALVILIFPTLLTAASLGSRILIKGSAPSGVVVADSISLSSTPQQGPSSGAVLQNGTEIILTEQVGDWAHITVPGKRLEGWLPLDSIEFIDAPSEVFTRSQL